MAKRTMKPEQTAQMSGEYGIVGPTGEERRVVRGKAMPPTPKPGQGYVMDRPAHNAAGRGRKK
jgi:hypothetical protein